MLYLVECQKKGSDTGKYISLYPEGLEAESRKEAVHSAFALLIKNGGVRNGNMITISGNTYSDFYAKPKKWASYKSPMSDKDRKEAFENELMDMLTSKGFSPDFCLNGIRVKTGVDTWIIEVRQVFDNDAQLNIFHKNNWNANNDRNGYIPGFHKQSSGRFTADSLYDFLMDHENKWKPKKREVIFPKR